MRRPTIITGLVLLAASQVHAERYGPDYQECSHLPTVQLVECLEKKTREWDARLNNAYQTLLRELGPERRQVLREAQRSWMNYRDANCHFYAIGPGSISKVEAAECIRNMTQDRALELEQQGQRL
jgi:uncharacterized protein YecT (DUF1311 family)